MKYRTKLWIFVMIIMVLTAFGTLLDHKYNWYSMILVGGIAGFFSTKYGREIDEKLEVKECQEK